MEPSITFRTITITADEGDQEGRLVLQDEKLIAVLVRLASAPRGGRSNWLLAAGFGPCAGRTEMFRHLAFARRWVHRRLADQLET